MELKIKHYYSLPCEAEIFTINGIKANISDFCECNFSGNCMENTCRVEHEPILPTQEVLDKYNINLKEYEQVTEEIASECNVYCCGWCS